MNEELKKLLTNLAIDLTTQVQNGIDSGTAFVSTQAPILISEIVKIGIMKSIFGIIIFSVLTIICVVLSRNCFKKLAGDYREGGMLVAFIFSVVGSVAFVFGIVGNIYGLIFRLIAPRLYIIEQLKILF